MLNSIIIPFYNHYDLVHKRLSELYKFAPSNTEIVIVNDASTDDIIPIEGSLGWWKENGKHTIRYKKNKENLGFGGAHNAGYKIARGEVLIFLSNDVNIYGDFVTPIHDIVEDIENCLVGARMIDFNSGWNTSVMNDGEVRTFPYLEGWLVACHRKVWKQLGGWDERYAPSDYEDIDLSTTARYLGFKLINLTLPVAHNHLGTTIETIHRNRLEITNRNKQKFFQKWNEILIKNEL